MAAFLQAVGAITCGGVALFTLILAFKIIGNVYGGIKGAYRLRAILLAAGKPKRRHILTIRLGLKAWAGERNRNGFGSYFKIGGLEVPVDGRDPIRPSKW